MSLTFLKLKDILGLQIDRERVEGAKILSNFRGLICVRGIFTCGAGSGERMDLLELRLERLGLLFSTVIVCLILFC